MDTQLILKSASSPLHSVDAVDSDTTPETAEMMNFTALTVPKATDIEALTTEFGTAIDSHCPCYNKEVTTYKKTRDYYGKSILENTQLPFNIATESSNEPLKILQINLARAKAATNQLHLTASTIKPYVILVQEQ
ncbi:hypothetical protein AVEN_68781-1 [Araneus ventricosus]|uniref:Uncharacterized protein n=1 Tax=Araneus ventricosus TaxID=182803 RepID=A0A4Y2C6R0_ARAVE|nr:hypothetical protein AVEN_68781-1 [Araneus ventricosus]